MSCGVRAGSMSYLAAHLLLYMNTFEVRVARGACAHRPGIVPQAFVCLANMMNSPFFYVRLRACVAVCACVCVCTYFCLSVCVVLRRG